VKEYVWLDDTLVAVLSSFDASTYQYVETDHLGTPRAVVHPTKNTISWRWDVNNTAFGEHLPNGNPDGDSLTYDLSLRYPGQYYDSESGLNYNYFRDYDPATGRYIESDPIGLTGGASTYSYVGSRPLDQADPSGLNPALATCVDPAQPICWAGVLAAVVPTLMIWAEAYNVADEVARQSEYSAYKSRCNQPPPPGLDPCAEAKWKLKRNTDCMNMRQAWDNKWLPGRHAGDIQNLQASIQKLTSWIAANCGKCTP
jgi:RHS repeat-associated protein